MKMQCCLATYAIILSVLVGNGADGISFASYFGNHMVLQRAPQRATVWGYGSTVGNTVTVVLSGEGAYNTTVTSAAYLKKGGIWKVMLPAVGIGGPYDITVTENSVGAGNSGGTDKARIADVWFGDVWICSGQSNMQFTLDMGFNASTELEESSNYPLIRVFTVKETQSTTPQFDLLAVEEPWSIPNKDTVGHKPWTYFSAVCWLYGKYLFQTLGYPIGLVDTTWGGTPIEDWSSPDALAQCQTPRPQQRFEDPGLPKSVDLTNSSLWNAMIHPFLNMTIYGAIWYQGEANAHKPDTYNCTFPAMINDWRQKFHEGSQQETQSDFPFGFVQLAPNRNDSSIVHGFPDIRWHQTADMGFVPNAILERVFMAVALDLPDFSSPHGGVHPRDKQDVAARLVLSALPVAYNFHKKGKFQGPLPSAYFIDIGFKTLTIEYDNSKTPIQVFAKDGFEVCCSRNNQSLCDPTDATWVDAPITQKTSFRVTMSYKRGCDNQYVVGVRYLWRESPCAFKACPVYSVENNLPAPPYIAIGLIGQKWSPSPGRYVYVN